MKIKLFLLVFAFISFSCKTSGEATTTDADKDLKFEFTIDGKKFSFASEDVSTSYQEFGKGNHEFKVFVGSDYGKLALNMTITADMTKPSSTPNGDPNPGNALFQGSVSLQNYPEKSFTFNSYDGLQNPKPKPVSDAIVITSSVLEAGGKARIISGTINTVVLGGENKSKDPKIKDYVVKGSFTIRHEFTKGAF